MKTAEEHIFILLFTVSFIYSYNLNQKWKKFKIVHKKNYASQNEEEFRRKIFEEKLQKIREHNSKFKNKFESYQIGVNQFSDLKKEELSTYYNISSQILKHTSHTMLFKEFPYKLPTSFDWRERNITTKVKNQNTCGACWAFSATGTLESHLQIYKNLNVNLSEQQLIDCVSDSSGCDGGWMTNAYLYIQQNDGVNYEQYYPYEEIKSSCRFKANEPNIKIRDFKSFENVNEEFLKYLLVYVGPISVVFDGRGSFVDYKAGIYYNPFCSQNVFTHAGIITGYGTEDGRDFWWLKNSWGSQWGLKGYIKITRNINHCGIASKISYPIL